MWRVPGNAWVAVFILSVVSHAAGRSMTLVADGRPRAAIVLSAAPSDVERTAAGDLQGYLLKMSAVEVPVLETDALPDDPAILIGESAAVSRLVGRLLTGEHLGPDGFILKTFPDRLVVVGRKAHPSEYPYHGTRYAVFALLEELGCRFFTPNPDGEHVPERETLSVGDLDIVSRADFIFRSPWNNGYIRPTLTERTQQAWREWMMKNRLGWASPIDHGHAYEQWCSADRYFAEHPEYFTFMRARRRRIPMTAQEGQLCLSSPEVAQVAVEAARKRLVDGLARSFSLSPNDTREWCECGHCLAMDDPDPAIGLATRVLRFNNQVALEVGKTLPGRLFPYLGEYGNMTGPPVRDDGTVVLKAHPAVMNVTVMGKRFCALHVITDPDCPKNLEYRRRLDAWGQVVQNQMFYEWLNPGYRLSTPQTWIIGPRIRYYRDLGGLGYSGEILGRSPDNDLTLYIAARMLWDADQDDRALIEEFFRLYYQEAAAPMEAFYRGLNRVGRRPGFHNWLLPFEAWTPEVFRMLFTHLDRARQTALQPIIRRRVERDRVALTAYRTFMRAIDAHRKWQRESTPAQRQSALQAIDQAMEFLTTIADQDIVADKWLRDSRLRNLKNDILPGRASRPVGARTIRGWSDEDTFGDLWEQFEELVRVPDVWEFRLDPKNRGEAENWFRPDAADTSWEDIRVGEFWELQGHPDYNGLAWYRLRLPIPDAARGRKLLLYFGAADERAHVWVNGHEAGHHDIGDAGWDKRFAIDITRFARPGEDNLIAVRVGDTMAMGGLWKSVKLVSPKMMVEAAAPVGQDMALDLGGDLQMEFVWIDAMKCWVGRYEVTNGEFRRFDPDHDSRAFTHVTTGERLTLNGDRQPVVYVSYDEAVKFAGWLSRTCASRIPEGYRVRLPSGGEWLAFAQCGDADRAYPWGSRWPPPDDWNYQGSEGAAGGPKIAGHDDGHPVSCAVDESGRNTWGLQGVGGNVWEWTTDQSGPSRIVRGVSWNYSNQDNLRCSADHRNLPSDRSNVIGFRLLIAR